MLQVTDELSINDSELEFEFSRSGGPGGQNVNKVETKVTVRWNVRSSPSLSEAQRARLLDRLATRITNEGVLRVTSQRHRTREANRKAALERLAEVVGRALHEAPERKRTRVPTRVRRKRLESKRRRSEKKALRGRVDSD